MINLIPPSAQKQVKHEYWIRVVILWMFLAGTSFLVFFIFLIPSYVLVHNQLDSFSEKFIHADTNNQSLKISEHSIAEVNAISVLLASSENTKTFSSVLDEIEKITGDDIILLDFAVMRIGDSFSSIVISGTAPSRASLSSFRDDLDAQPLFEKVELPLASLAKDKDIPFTITITPLKTKSK